MRRMANEVFEAVRTVLAVREYAESDITADVVRRSAEVGRPTASTSNDEVVSGELFGSPLR